jgi:hypothetical protein
MIIATKRIKPFIIPFYFVLLTLLSSSCATIFNGSKQRVMFTSNPAGAEVFVNGKTTGKFTPCTVNVRRKVKAGPNNRQNEQYYVLKKEGYHDYEIKDWRGISSGATIGNSIATLLGASFIAVGVGDTALTSTGFMLGLPMVASFPIDFMTGAIYTYDKQINANLVKKEREIVYLKTDSTVFKPTEPTEKLAKVYAVIVGVSDYHDKKMNLKYADDDARLFYNFLKSPNGGAVPDQNITLLLNTDATRANIIKAVNNQFKSAFEEDVVIVYMASHGVPSSHGDELYFLGADTDRENLEGTGVSQYDIQKALNNCRSQKKIWISDACHSGSVGANGSIMRGEEERAASNMVNRLLSNVASYDKSLILLTASSAGETSQESAQWGGGHGVFTHYLVEGLQGAADENKNGLVDVRELYEYVRSRVSKDTNKKQFPELKGVYQNRFPMSVVTAK